VFTTLNTAVFTPIPSASTVAAAIVNAGAFSSCRNANLKSRIMFKLVRSVSTAPWIQKFFHFENGYCNAHATASNEVVSR